MYGLSGKITAHAGQRDALIEILLNAAGVLEEVDGCYLYIVSSVPDDPDAVQVTEIWRSQADHQASLSNEGVRALITEGRPLIAGMSDRVEFTPIGGKGLNV